MHGRRMLRPIALLTATCALMLLPGIALAEIDGGFMRYLRESLELSRQEAGRTTNTGVRFIIDPSQPLLRHLDAGHPPAPRIAVQWVPALTPELRRRAEAELGLSDPVRRTDASELEPTPSMTHSRHHSCIIVGDPRVRDTDGIDRTTRSAFDDSSSACSRMDSGAAAMADGARDFHVRERLAVALCRRLGCGALCGVLALRPST